MYKKEGIARSAGAHRRPEVNLDHGIPSVMFTSGITLRNNKAEDNAASLDYSILRRRVLAMIYYLVRVI